MHNELQWQRVVMLELRDVKWKGKMPLTGSINQVNEHNIQRCHPTVHTPTVHQHENTW